MRTRETIEKVIGNGIGFTFVEKTIIGLLLDIRDLLTTLKDK